ncbi:transposase [Granulosicoccaceae sp. 1_MG-2023]|nr:transposase [Granulosicoccaceae sp. 1_MG-2023]
MPKPRKELVSLDATPYYHCTSRCVRRSFLCGVDRDGRSYEHRRAWIESLLLKQAQAFSIEIAAYAIMSNHFHVVLYVDQAAAKSLTDADVVRRWHSLYQGSPLSRRFANGEALSAGERFYLDKSIRDWRSRLISISWFMRRLNETVARLANDEDGCTGHFWEGRFKSQALLDEKALAACMAYVDLNPIRAGLARTPETSDYTSVKKRAAQARRARLPNHPQQQVRHLLPFAGNPQEPMPHGIPMPLTDYLDLLDWTGRQLRQDKRGSINCDEPPILDRIGIAPGDWLHLTQHFETEFTGLVGAVTSLRSKIKHFWRERHENRRISGLRACSLRFT